jgi:hypothetical protein
MGEKGYMNRHAAYARCIDFIRAHMPKILVGAFLSFVAAAASAQRDWPEIVLPARIRAVDVGGQITVNGLPMRVKGFVAPGAPSDVADEFRKALGQPLMESRVAGKLVLGRMQGDFYLSVQIEPSGSGSRGAATVTNLKLAAERRIGATAERERWLNRLPAGSRLISHVTSEDAGKSSSHFVLTNGLTDDVNAARLKSMLSEDGMSLERETQSAGAGYAPQGRTLYFRGPNKEAIAVIAHVNGDTAVVLNVITQLGRIQ